MPDYTVLPYNRELAVSYARRWAYGRNPAFYDFSEIGGDCTNFASQCIYAGAGIMNFTPTYGWFYRSAQIRTASWTGVEYLYNFLVTNEGAGPFAKVVPLSEIQRGDIVQLGRETGDFYHSPVVVRVTADGEILVAAHSYDVYGKSLLSYNAPVMRGLHILGARKPT